MRDSTNNPSEKSCGCGGNDSSPTVTATVPVGGNEETFHVNGMDCAEEIAAIERAVKPLPGVSGVRANLMASTVTIFHDGNVQSPALVAAINSTGVKVKTDGRSGDGNILILPKLLVILGLFDVLSG